MSASLPPYLYYVGVFAVSGFVSLLFAYRIHTRYDARGTKTLAYSFVGVGLWALNSAARTIAADPVVTVILLSTEMALVVATARIWFIFAAQYTNRNIHRDRRVQHGLHVYVFAALVVPLTNPWHGLVWRSISAVNEPFVHYSISKGPAHYAFTLSAYFLVLVGLVFLFRMLRSTSHTRAIVSLVVGFFFLVGVNVIPYVIETTITHTTTLTPLGALAFVLMAAIAIRNNLFAVTPVARDRVFDAINDPVVMLDRDHQIIDHNSAFASVFTDGFDVAHESFSVACPDLSGSLNLPLQGPEHLVYPNEDNGDRTYTVTSSPLQSGPHLLGRVLVFRDITDLITSQWELARKNSQLDEFADSVAHDLRNPLSVILAHADLLRTHLEQMNQHEVEYDHHLSMNAVDQVEKHGNRISSIIDDFLKVTREAKTLHDIDPLNFDQLVQETARDHIPLSALRVATGGELFASPPHARLLLDAVFRNIAHRSVEEMTVTARLTDDGFVIEDTGESVPEEVADQLLEYGFTTQYRGGGLGLSIAKTVAEAHQWSITIDTEYRDGLRIVVRNVATSVDATGRNDTSIPKI